MAVAAELMHEDWRRLLMCKPTPDPRILKDLNGFVNAQEDVVCETFESVMEKFRVRLSTSRREHCRGASAL